MSGGVDSSAAAMLLQQQGYDVTGATLRMFSNEDLGLEQDSACCSLSDVEDAKLVAHKLGIPHYVFNFSPCFRHCVIDRFISEYEAGRTPNPCVDCKKHIKFGELLDRARLMDCEYLATGHYARFNPLFIASYKPLSGSLIQEAIPDSYCLMISTVLSFDAPSINIYSIFGYDWLSTLNIVRSNHRSAL